MATWSSIGPWKFISIPWMDGAQSRGLFPFCWMREVSHGETVPCWHLSSSTGKLTPAMLSSHPSISKHTSKGQQHPWAVLIQLQRKKHLCWGMSRSQRRRQTNLEKVTKNGEMLIWQQQGQRGMGERQDLGHSRDAGVARLWNERSSWATCVLVYSRAVVLHPGGRLSVTIALQGWSQNWWSGSWSGLERKDRSCSVRHHSSPLLLTGLLSVILVYL